MCIRDRNREAFEHTCAHGENDDNNDDDNILLTKPGGILLIQFHPPITMEQRKSTLGPPVPKQTSK